MLEGLVAWVLNNYLGKYVENLNTDQLSIALLSGKVELENLPLRKDALRHLGLPVEIKAGFIGKVQLHVPVRQIRSAPWLISIEKLYLVATPVNLDEWDSAVEANIAHERKMSLLDALEAHWRADHEASDAGYYASSYSSWLSYGTGLLANIVENLQLKVNDVHIRYEDSLTCCPRAFACGLTLASLTAESCDSAWRRGFTLLAESDGCSYKLLELTQLAVYWDPMPVPHGMFANCTLAELTERMSQPPARPHRYTVAPASARARVRRERTELPLRSRTTPRYSAHLTLDTVQCTVTKSQWTEMAQCSRGLERVQAVRSLRARRPPAPPRLAPRLWWKYAVQCHLPHHTWMEPRPTWAACAAAARDAARYVAACLGQLSHPAATLPPEQRAFKDDYEWRTPLNVLKPLREVAMRKVPKVTPVSTPETPASSGRSMLVHWFPQWWGWYGPPKEGEPPEAPPSEGAAPPQGLEDEILDVIADSLDNNTLLKRDTVFAKLEFTLNKGSLLLCSDNVDDQAARSGMHVCCSVVRAGVEWRVRSAACSLRVSLQALCVARAPPPPSAAPAGVIREYISSLINSGGGATSAGPGPRGGPWWGPLVAPAQEEAEPLFQLTYEKKPFGLNCDHKLWVKSLGLEILYSLEAIQWLHEFTTGAVRQAALQDLPPQGGEGAGAGARQNLISRWEHMLRAKPSERRAWLLELDISAPQLFFVEALGSRESALLVVDFGRLRLANADLPVLDTHASYDDDDEMFMTPCSTPPGSPQSPTSPVPPVNAPPPHHIDAAALHHSIYDSYKIELSDLQILVGRARDNWKFAHTKPTSSLHLLDRFNISLLLEMRSVWTLDPVYPWVALRGSLPALTAHLSEHKLRRARHVLAALAPAPKKEIMPNEAAREEAQSEKQEEEENSRSECEPQNHSTLLMLQFAIDQMSLEVQSRGRSIAEVQVMGVRAALTARPRDLAASLSVHSLLLVDALQTYGADCELLVASHKHVGMDTASGSIRDSEPTSPTSPTSPASPAPPDGHAHPHILHQALYSLYGSLVNKNPEPERVSPTPTFPSARNMTPGPLSPGPTFPGPTSPGAPPWGPPGTAGWGATGMVDSEALIAVELCFVKGEGDSEDLRIANILFNNLDIIANQETIVELIGFTQRVMADDSTSKKPPPSADLGEPASDAAVLAAPSSDDDNKKKEARTEITFDFHRLGVLLLRAATEDGQLVAKKIATATLSEAKIQATFAGSSISAGGSLGGLQVVSLCPGAGLHSRVVSAGAPPAHGTHAAHATHANDDRALHFQVDRRIVCNGEETVVDMSISVHIASVWYTHSGPFLRELRSCVAEFQQYLANLARSIRAAAAAAADLAIHAVQPRSESLMSPRGPQAERVSPRRRTFSVGCSVDDDLTRDNIHLVVNVELESPVVVMPRGARSRQVLVAHLGTMSLCHRPPEPGPPGAAGAAGDDSAGAEVQPALSVRVRDISLAALEVSTEQLRDITSARMEDVYSARASVPVVHNTALTLSVLSDQGATEQWRIEGGVVGALQVCARREQYEQLLDTIRHHSAPQNATYEPPARHTHLVEEPVSEGAVLRLDPAIRAAVLAVPPPQPPPTPPPALFTVKFELPELRVELRADLGAGERSLVQLACRDFRLHLARPRPAEACLQVSLHSITMEDLTKDPDSKHRMLMVSHTPQVPPKTVFVSRSCPDFFTQGEFSSQMNRSKSTSLPSVLHVADQKHKRPSKQDSKCGVTPPCSPETGARGVGGQAQASMDMPHSDETDDKDEDWGEWEEGWKEIDDIFGGEGGDLPREDDNLVWVSVHTRDPSHPEFETKYQKVSKVTKVDFNCLSLVVNVASWVAVLDFFGVGGEDEPSDQQGGPAADDADATAPSDTDISETELRVRSLVVVVVSPRGETCQARATLGALRGRREGGAGARRVRGGLHALTLRDLTPHAPLWRHTLQTRPTRAIMWTYERLSPAAAAVAGHETSLSISMGPLTYVHSRRFILELAAFARDFRLLRRVIAQARSKVSVAVHTALARMRLALHVRAPVVAAPVSGRSRRALLAQLHSLTLRNHFTSTPAGSQLEVRTILVSKLRLWAGRAARAGRVRRGGRGGRALLAAPARLHLTAEINGGPHKDVADMSVHGTLATLQITLDASQYRLLRAVLVHNLTAPCSDLQPPAQSEPVIAADVEQQVWKTSSLKLELQDVTVKLEPEQGAAPLACVNFIKSRLVIETFSDLTQDIDLVSQEILVSDTRFSGEPANRRGNVFSHIAQPLPEHAHSVQAELHARKRVDSAAYTILVNKMRVMAILDWWEAVAQFVALPPLPPADPDQLPLEESVVDNSGAPGGEGPASAGSMELKLNITDSQLVFVEDASVWDTNAVILKSTAVLRWRGWAAACPAACVLSELELFSCVLGLEEDTALSIVPGAAVRAELRHAQLTISTTTLNLRLSYHDMKMFASMLRSLPLQARAALSGKPLPLEASDAPANREHMRARDGGGRGAGRGLRLPGPAPAWLRGRGPPDPQQTATSVSEKSAVHLSSVKVEAECVTLCVIDDCRDSDVPLLEAALSDLRLEQDLRKAQDQWEDPMLVSTPAGGAPGVPARRGAGGGALNAVLSVDYYNRTLSGWEPFIEPWRFSSQWEHSAPSSVCPSRSKVSVRSERPALVNVTSSLVELGQLVRGNWSADYYAPPAAPPAGSPKGSPQGHRRRSPFVPYALRNHTGHRLWFTTLLTSSDAAVETGARPGGPDDSWVAVRAGDTEPFSFGSRRGRGGRAAGALHQLALRLGGWAPPDPVCVDRVGVFFRNITHSATGTTARIVFEVSLEGSARKLVTVRSALQLHNNTPHAHELRLRPHAQWSSGPRGAVVPPGAVWAAPLSESLDALYVRPLLPAPALAPAPVAVDWRGAGASPALVLYECRAATQAEVVYRFCCVVIRERFPPGPGGTDSIPGHTLQLVPALRLQNLLPLELQYCATQNDIALTQQLAPQAAQPFHQFNIEESIEMSVKMEGFGWSSPLLVGGSASSSFTARLKLRDSKGRRLYLNARVSVKKTDGIKVSISAAYWLVNRTGLPLVFRAEGGAEAAGQGAEHELARMLQPLPFAFAAPDAMPTLAVRLGTGMGADPQWCSPFGLGPGVAVKKLEVRGVDDVTGGGGGERTCAVGVSVRAGRGRYRHTNIVSFSPRYQLHNNTKHHLQFAQSCTATTLNDPGAIATHMSAVSGCHLPWQWARWDREQLLCVRVLKHQQRPGPPEPATAWSGGFRLVPARSLHLACREPDGSYQLIRAEVVSQGATLFVLLTDGDSAPPPLRVDNHSPVSVIFHQVGCAEEVAVGAHASAAWALPQPEGPAALVLRAPGGPRSTVPLDQLQTTHYLLYQNFIYIVFTHTADNRDSSGSAAAEDDGALVLEVPLGSNKVVIGRKRYGDRSQLWRVGGGGQLIHEGSSPPQPTPAPRDAAPHAAPHALVLDIAEAAPRPGRAATLQLRRADGRRGSTQAWRVAAGRMLCAHATLCVQPAGGVLAPGIPVTLGLPTSDPSGPAPATEAVSWRSLRAGSGRLAVALQARGPTRTLAITDHHQPESGWLENGEEDDCPPVSHEWEVSISLDMLSISLVGGSPPAELVHGSLRGVRGTAERGGRALRADLTVMQMQWDNQLLGTPSPVLLYMLDPPLGPASSPRPALLASVELVHAPAKYNARYCRHLVVALSPMAVRLEERLILSLWAWACPSEEGAAAADPELEEQESMRVLHELCALHATRYYCALLEITAAQIRLSMCTANKLSGSLAALKRRLGLTLIRFEDACVELEGFRRGHVYEPPRAIARQVLQHYTDELKWQAAKILGSVDFLGNPLGFVADVSEGVSGLILEGNVAALLKNVTHGISNSAAKVTESLGDGLERVVGDEAHEETRRRIRSAAPGHHLAAGLRGLGLGLLGGVTSLVKHSYEGAADGLGGLVAGVGKGLLGTVTKPVIGVLDLAAEAAAALRDSSRRSDKCVPERVRLPRVAQGAGGLLPRYCGAAARGMALLHELNARHYRERFLAYRDVRAAPHDIRALLSHTHLRIFTCHTAPHLVMEAHLSNLVSCTAVTCDGAHYVELAVRGGGSGASGAGGAGGEPVRRPRVQCDSEEIALWLARHAAYAKQIYYEEAHTLQPNDDL